VRKSGICEFVVPCDTEFAMKRPYFSTSGFVVALTLVQCTRTTTTSVTGTVLNATTRPAASAARTCADVAPVAGFDCVQTPMGPGLAVAASAPVTLEPCTVATCPANTRCESHTNEGRLLPVCTPTTQVGPFPANRDPCAHYLCPLGYHCSAPADAPYCISDLAQ
jgi:hypothetical protein